MEAMTCACCQSETPAVIIWTSIARPDETHAVKLAVCLPCSERIDRNAMHPIGMETKEVMTREEARRRYPGARLPKTAS